MIRQDEVVSNHGNVYLPKQFLQESETAQKAVELFLAKPTVVDITQPLERVKNSLGLNLSKRQSEGVEMVFRHNLSIITGGPGTGKTTVLKTVIEVYRQLYPRQKIVLRRPQVRRAGVWRRQRGSMKHRRSTASWGFTVIRNPRKTGNGNRWRQGS